MIVPLCLYSGIAGLPRRARLMSEGKGCVLCFDSGLLVELVIVELGLNLLMDQLVLDELESALVLMVLMQQEVVVVPPRH